MWLKESTLRVSVGFQVPKKELSVLVMGYTPVSCRLGRSLILCKHEDYLSLLLVPCQNWMKNFYCSSYYILLVVGYEEIKLILS